MTRRELLVKGAVCAVSLGAIGAAGTSILRASRAGDANAPTHPFKSRGALDTGGFGAAFGALETWRPEAPLTEIAAKWTGLASREIERIGRQLASSKLAPHERVGLMLSRAGLFNFDAQPERGYEEATNARRLVEGAAGLAADWLYPIIFMQGICALRLGETENCVHCRGVSACILPIAREAKHTLPRGSRLAVEHLTEYLGGFPGDLQVEWLLNLAHMTLGEYPTHVPIQYLVPLNRWTESDASIGKFRDISFSVGVDRMNCAGGAILEDFDNDGRLDLVVTSFDPAAPMAYYHNDGHGRFVDRTRESGLADQLGGLYCVQTDYNNDGHMDIFVPRGAWFKYPMRPSLLRNNGDGTFSDVTEAAGLLHGASSNSAAWADYDNDGFLDLFICNEQGPNLLYHNEGDGTFRNVTDHAGLGHKSGTMCKGVTWIDYDNDGYPDLFLNYLDGTAQLMHNERNGRFTDVTRAMGIDGPQQGFSCWCWDYNNDGWLDIFATSYYHPVDTLVRGLLGPARARYPNKLYRNHGGTRFEDATAEAGLDMVFATMGSNFADLDNDGFPDFYLGTGDPQLGTLVPNRMFRNVGGKRFVEITATSRTGHLQKGHAVSCGDWDRDGNVDVFIQVGGLVPGDQYHNVLFQSPGSKNQWLTVKLVGKKTNRPAIGARIKVVTAGSKPQTIHRLVSSGSSFGANPLQQTIGLGRADRVATLEVHWPTSGTTQVFHNVDVDQAIEVTEFAAEYRKLGWTRLPVPA